MLIRYIRSNDGRKIGCLLAQVVDGVVYFGWSKLNKKDRFNKHTAKGIASLRIQAQTQGRELKWEHIPSVVRQWIPHFEERASTYFKDKNNFKWLSPEEVSESHHMGAW